MKIELHDIELNVVHERRRPYTWPSIRVYTYFFRRWFFPSVAFCVLAANCHSFEIEFFGRWNVSASIIANKKNAERKIPPEKRMEKMYTENPFERIHRTLHIKRCVMPILSFFLSNIDPLIRFNEKNKGTAEISSLRLLCAFNFFLSVSCTHSHHHVANNRLR